MNEAECFIRHNLPAEREANYATEICVKYVKWKDNCNILDVGCGTGNVTHDILLPLLPKSTNSVIGIDKKTSSIDYANNHYSIEGKLTFQAVNIIEDHQFFENHEEHFDHIVSFSCLHFLREQETALRNIYKMLKPGGDFSFSCVVNATIFILLENIAKMEKWNPFVAQYVNYMSPYQFAPNPKEELQKMLIMTGFRVVNLTIEPRPLNLPLSYFPGHFISHVPVEIPTDLHVDFGLCTLDVIRQLNFNHFDDNHVEYCSYDFDTIVGHVTNSTDVMPQSVPTTKQKTTRTTPTNFSKDDDLIPQTTNGLHQDHLTSLAGRYTQTSATPLIPFSTGLSPIGQPYSAELCNYGPVYHPHNILHNYNTVYSSDKGVRGSNFGRHMYGNYAATFYGGGPNLRTPAVHQSNYDFTPR